jgi:hypothetical protein
MLKEGSVASFMAMLQYFRQPNAMVLLSPSRPITRTKAMFLQRKCSVIL